MLETWAVDAYGSVAFLNSVPTSNSWSIILPLNVTGAPFSDLLCYDAAKGVGELFTSDGQGGLRLLKSFLGWRTNWSVILSPSSGQLMFYSAGVRGRGVLLAGRAWDADAAKNPSGLAHRLGADPYRQLRRSHLTGDRALAVPLAEAWSAVRLAGAGPPGYDSGQALSAGDRRAVPGGSCT